MRADVQGTVVLDAVIGVDGLVEASRVRCSIHRSLDVQATQALKAWEFEPALLKGRPTRFVVEVQMEFLLYKEEEVRFPAPPRKKPCATAPRTLDSGPWTLDPGLRNRRRLTGV